MSYEDWQPITNTFRAFAPGILCAAYLFCFPNSAFSQEVPCRPGISPNHARQTTTKMLGDLPLEQFITVRYKASYYRIKLAYLTFWGTPKSIQNPSGYDLEGVNEFKALSYYFWMPSLRYSEADEMIDRSHRPCENGRSIPSVDKPEYIVKVHSTDIGTNANGALMTPDYLYETQFKYVPSKDIRTEEKYGLIKASNNISPHWAYDVYHSKRGGKLQAYIQCSKSNRSLPNPNCEGKFYYPDRATYLEVQYPVDAQPHWRKILAAAENLQNQWLINDPEEIKRLTALSTLSSAHH